MGGLPPVTPSTMLGMASPDVPLDQSFGLDATLPALSSRTVIVTPPNPFLDNAVNHIPQINSTAKFLPQNGQVNGYIKFQFRKSDLQEEPRSTHPIRLQSTENNETPNDHAEPEASPHSRLMLEQALGIAPEGSVLKMPPDFGLGCKLSNVERKLFRFCKSRSHVLLG